MSDITSSHVVKIEGFKSKSASPTDVWLATLKDSEYKQVFIKMYISPSAKIAAIDKDTNEQFKAMDYEADIYKITRANLDAHVSPTFIRIYDTKTMNFKGLMDWVDGNVRAPDGKLYSDYDLKYHVFRNLRYMFDNIPGRPSINTAMTKQELDLLPPKEIDFFEKLNFSMIITKPSIPALDLEEFLTAKKYKALPEILFQIAVGCYTLFLNGINHNDLHYGNSLMKVSSKPVTRIYHVDGKTYYTKSVYLPLIYDFDRSYVKSKGANKSISGFLCNEYSQCNNLIGTKDFLKIMCYTYHFLDAKTQKNVLTLFTDNEKDKQFIHESYMQVKGCYLLKEVRAKILQKWSDADFERLYDMPTVIDRIYHMWVKREILPFNVDDVQFKRVYVIDSNCFPKSRANDPITKMDVGKVKRVREAVYEAIHMEKGLSIGVRASPDTSKSVARKRTVAVPSVMGVSTRRRRKSPCKAETPRSNVKRSKSLSRTRLKARRRGTRS